MIVIIGVAVLFGLLALFAFLVSIMMANNRKRAGPPRPVSRPSGS